MSSPTPHKANLQDEVRRLKAEAAELSAERDKALKRAEATASERDSLKQQLTDIRRAVSPAGSPPPSPAPAGAPPTDQASATLATSRARVLRCLQSAVLWADELPRYANFQQSKADWWAIGAGVVAAVTGLAIFPVVTDSSTTADKFVVAGFAFLAAIMALVPRIKNYSELAGQARELAGMYGPLVGRLLDALAATDAGPNDSEAVRTAISDFETAKAKKDQLRYLPGGTRLAAARTRAKQQCEELTKPS